MLTVYVLYSSSFNKIYIGYTSDLANRLLSHNELGTTGYTLKYRPWTILFTEDYITKTQALKREKQLKGAKGREYIGAVIKTDLESKAMHVGK